MIEKLKPENFVSEQNKYLNLLKNKKASIFLVSFFILCGLYLFLYRPPTDFPLGQIITIYPGETLQEISESLRDSKVIKYPLLFRVHVIAQGGEKKVMAGDYLLDRIEGPADIAYRVVGGQFHIETVKITIPEGWNTFQMADYLAKNLLNFNRNAFLNLAKKEEGYLFPDTYFVSPAIKYDKLILLMRQNFGRKIESIPEISKSKYSLKEIITMASILESEARTAESRRTIAGILWKRLSIDMPLQVDSTFIYINGKNTYELTVQDLEIDSPYNTYKYKGLPPGPIGNPGIEAIRDAVTPITTKYLYYLSSRSGDMYYATTFEQHKKNIQLYLNK